MAKMVKHPELVAMSSILKILSELNSEQQARVLGWVNSASGKKFEDATSLFDNLEPEIPNAGVKPQ